MTNEKILERIGLNKNESLVYLALLKSGSSNISKISTKSGLHRPLVYKAITTLVEKKIISYSHKGKTRIFLAEPPNRLETIFEDFQADFFNLMPELEDLYTSNSNKPKVRFFTGKDGTKRVFDDVVRSLKRGDTFYRYSSNKDGNEKRDRYLPRSYKKIRDSKKLQRMVITNSQTEKNKGPSLDRFLKVMPDESGKFEYNVTQLIYGNKVAFIDYQSEVAMIIESQAIADLQKHAFKVFYKKL